MCGVAGIYVVGRGALPERRELEAMVGRLAHRGPDGTGFLVDKRIGLAHSRLSIIDLAGGQQPIHNEDQTVWVVFNGEIFNYIELRRKLEGEGHRFYTHSDTEVIVHLYEEHGERFVDYLNGQFAIALWDTRLGRLLLARDRTGIRPLFYTENSGRLLFASEIKALFALPEVPRRFDPRALAEICAYWAPLAPRTAFAGVSSLPPGHLMVVDNGRARVQRYWDWKFPEKISTAQLQRSAEDYAEELRDLLIDAVRLQLRADVPVGAYLSGGLDSSIITALIRHFTTTPLRTFSLTFEDDEFDESAHQREMAAFLGTEHTSIRCTRADIAAAFPQTIFHTETPIVRTAPTPLMLLSGHVRASGYKVVLTGEGADEVFGGYDLFKEAKIRRFWARFPESRIRPLILARLYPYLKNSPAGGRAFSEAFFKEGIEFGDQPWFAHLPRWRTTQRIRQFFSSELRASLADWDPCESLSATMPPDIRSWIPLGRDQYVEAHTLMSGYLLCSQGDRMAMANSIEGRFPFLDHRLIEFANQLPPQLKIQGLTEKYLLKRAMTGLIPPSVRKRTKQPYRAPDSQSFFNDEGHPVDYVAELFSPAKIAAAGYFDANATGKLYRKCQAGRAIGFADNMAFVTILSTMLLHEQFILGHDTGTESKNHAASSLF
ncbi:asparagine synthase (glutamine-hydrolyzing) [Desulfurivibrio alkaliphilus]|uniref:asparagine synthase (glutamine-hydrolyzing) n=1 Tax=Desulfurivibrio alkaliphilus (strain DSM 19089 / UNIQEM U267 / AHT2) TaxID=589865 RepID=D6Z4G9_DESAT|nr:asparagine synthase (glutamine-hydrolyzing) [Desulfurivibrio alkaliphilus]ADH86444.1 asparagine synthase (glutamine-hydrolyzing) [Desulfurivibrio alkaliphilus AHT 2]